MKKKSNLFITLLILVPGIFSFGQGTWTQKANFPLGSISEATSFSIGTKGYIGGMTNDLWEYDQASDTWTQMATFIGSIRNSAAAFTIGTKGYLGTGGNFNDFYEWDQASNTWTQKANFGGSAREGAVGFSTSTKGYMGTGGNYLNDLWEYDPLLDSWTQVASLPATGRYHAVAFAINDKGYVCAGFSGSFLNDLWEYDPSLNSWLQMASLPGNARDRPEGFSIGTKGYIAVGWDGSNALTDFYEWDQSSNTWISMPAFGGAGRYNACSFVLGTKAYIGLGVGGTGDLWEFSPSCALQASVQTTSCASLCDGSSTVTLPSPGAVVSYAWNTIPVQTTQIATGLCASSYSITMTDTSGCTNTISVVIPSPPPIISTATSTSPGCFGQNNGSLCASASGGSGTFGGYVWANGQTTACCTGLTAGTYIVTVTDNGGCTGSSALILTQPTQMIPTLSHTDASCPNCPDGNATANISGGNGPYIFSWSNGVTNSAFITNLLPGIYTCCITDSNNCTVCDSTVVISPSGLPEKNWINSISCSPLPFNEYVLIEFENVKETIRQVTLFDITGRTCFRTDETIQNSTFKINTELLNPGIYFLVIYTNEKSGVLKLVKN